MSKEGFNNIDNIDYSDTVIDKLIAKNNDISDSSQLRFVCMDMYDLQYDEGTFDVVIDKATMDAVMTMNKDPWNPSEETKEKAKKVLDNVVRVLKKDGLFIQISFEQPHFRKKFLMTEELEKIWTYKLEKIQKGFEYFMYILTKY